VALTSLHGDEIIALGGRDDRVGRQPEMNLHDARDDVRVLKLPHAVLLGCHAVGLVLFW
jgi:hypothetical protein